MPTYYKLTDEKDQTYNKCRWGPGITHKTTGKGPLCSSGWTHWYTHPLLAVLLNPIHGNFNLTTAHLWKSPKKQIAQKFDHGLKVGCIEGTTLGRVELPKVTNIQIVAFGIFCSLEVYKEATFCSWAENWLSGKDRSVEAAKAAAWAAAEAAWAAAWTAKAAAWTAKAAKAATWAAAEAAWAAAWAAAWTAKAAKAAAWTAKAAAWTAKAAAEAEVKDFNLISIALKAIKVK